MCGRQSVPSFACGFYLKYDITPRFSDFASTPLAAVRRADDKNFAAISVRFCIWKMTSIGDLPTDVLWLVLRDVIARGERYYCEQQNTGQYVSKRPSGCMEKLLIDVVVPLSLTCKRFKRVILSKCKWNRAGDRWCFIKGAFAGYRVMSWYFV